VWKTCRKPSIYVIRSRSFSLPQRSQGRPVFPSPGCLGRGGVSRRDRADRADPAEHPFGGQQLVAVEGGMVRGNFLADLGDLQKGSADADSHANLQPGQDEAEGQDVLG